MNETLDPVVKYSFMPSNNNEIESRLEEKKTRDIVNLQNVNQWQITAWSDFYFAKWLYEILRNYPYYPYNWVCLIAFDCIEKAMKATMLAKDILNDDDLLEHCVDKYINRLAKCDPDFEIFKNEFKQMNLNKKYGYKTRWPNQHAECSIHGTYNHKSHCIPRDHFSQLDAFSILYLAKRVLVTMDMKLKELGYETKRIELQILPQWRISSSPL